MRRHLFQVPADNPIAKREKAFTATQVFLSCDKLIWIEQHARWSWGLSQRYRCHVVCAVAFEGDRMQSSYKNRACCIASLAAIIVLGLILANLSGIDLAQADATASPTASQSMKKLGTGEGVTPGMPGSTQIPSNTPTPAAAQKLDSSIQPTTSPALPSPASPDSASPAPSTRAISSCPNNQCSVTFDTAQADTASPVAQIVPSGGLAKRPTDPTKHGYLFDGWEMAAVQKIEKRPL